MVLRSLKSVPVIGELIYRAYLYIRYQDGKKCVIPSGPLKGMYFRKWVRSVFPNYLSGDHEPALVAAMLRHCRPNQTFFDVGANAGYMSLVAAKAVGPGGKVVSFEPFPNTVREMRSQLKINRVPNVFVEPMAVCDKPGTVQLYIETSADMLSVVDMHKRGGATISVPSTTIDEMTKKHGAPDVIKIDIEGAELLALRGAAKTLKEHRPLLLIELHTPELAKDCLELLDKLGYHHRSLSDEEIDRDQWTRFVISSPEFATVAAAKVA